MNKVPEKGKELADKLDELNNLTNQLPNLNINEEKKEEAEENLDDYMV